MKKVIKLVFVVLWMIGIFCFSNQDASESTKTSNGVIVSVTKVFVPKGLSKEKEDKIISSYTTIVRKTAHFILYLVLGILVINLLSEYKLKNLVILSILVCLLYAGSDEFHQHFVNGRSAELRDVIIDTSGASTGVLGYYFIRNKTKKSIKK